MAQTKKSSAGNGTSRSRSTKGRSTKGRTAGAKGSRKSGPVSEPMDVALRNEIILIVLFAVAVFLFLCNFGIVGVMGDTVSDAMFGIFGLTAYVMPLVLFLMIAFGMVNIGSTIAVRKLVARLEKFIKDVGKPMAEAVCLPVPLRISVTIFLGWRALSLF